MNAIDKIRDLIDSTQSVAYRKPRLAIKVASAIVDKVESLYDGDYEKVRQDVGSELSELIPILNAAAAADSAFTADAMEILFRLHTNDLVKTTFSNREAMDGLKKICSYRIDLTMEHALAAVETVEHWFGEEDDDRQTLSAELAGNLLTVTATGEYSDAATYTWSTSPIAISPALETVRQKAVKVLLGALKSDRPKLLSTAISATWNLGEAGFGHYQDTYPELSDLVNKESEILIAAFRGVLARDATYAPAASIEHQLWSWWRKGPEKISKLCAQAMRELPSGAEYGLWKAMYSGDLPIYASVPPDKLNKGERSDRNEFYHSCVELTETSSNGHFEPLFVEIARSRRDAEAWVSLFEEFDTDSQDDYAWRARHPIFDLAIFDPQLGWRIVQLLQERTLLPIICEPLLTSLRNSDPEFWDENLEANFEVNSLDLNTRHHREIPWIKALWGQPELTTVETQFLKGLTRHSDAAVRRQAAGALGHAIPFGENNAILHLAEVVRESPADIEMWHSLFAAFDTWKRNFPDPKTATPPLAILDLIRYVGNEAELARYRSYAGVTSFLRSVAKIWPHALAELIEQVWRDASDEGRHGRSSGILNDWHIEDTLRYLDNEQEKEIWAEILRSWISNQKMTSDLAVACMHNVADLSDPAQSEFVLSLACDSDPVLFSALRRMMWNYKSSAQYLDVMIELLKATHNFDEDRFEKIGQSLISDIPYCSTSRTVGQPSPVDIKLIEELKDHLGQPGLAVAIRSVLQGSLESLERNVNKQLMEDEERLRE